MHRVGGLSVEILSWFVRRWRIAHDPVEVTFAEVRRHLGVETQDAPTAQWSDQAIARTTPALLGLFSIVTVLTHGLAVRGGMLPLRQAAWYRKEVATFSDVLAAVRRSLWKQRHYGPCGPQTETVQIPRPLYQAMADALCHAA